MNHLFTHTQAIKRMAAELGFDYCGIAKAERLDADADRLENWLKKDMHGGMKYMENHFDLRVNPCLLVPGAKSVITLLKNYFPAQAQEKDAVRISKYAFGKDFSKAPFVPNTIGTVTRKAARKERGDAHSARDRVPAFQEYPDRQRAAGGLYSHAGRRGVC